MQIESIIGKKYIFARCLPLWYDGWLAEPISRLSLRGNGTIEGYHHENERTWCQFEGGFAFCNSLRLPTSTWFEQDGDGILVGRTNHAKEIPQRLCLIPDVPLPVDAKIFTIVASCKRFYRHTVPPLIAQLVEDGFALDEIKIVVNGAEVARSESIEGAEHLFTVHDGWEYSAYYEATRWQFDYALIIHDTTVVLPGCRSKLKSINGALDWDILPAITRCEHGIAVASHKYLSGLRGRLGQLDKISKFDAVFIEHSGDLLRGAKRAFALYPHRIVESKRSEQLIAGGQQRDKIFLKGLNLYKFLNLNSCVTGTAHYL